jgi:hypothetical protein
MVRIMVKHSLQLAKPDAKKHGSDTFPVGRFAAVRSNVLVFDMTYRISLCIFQ